MSRLCRLLSIALFAAALALVGVRPVEAEGQRVALVIGNGAYRSLPRLSNSPHDSVAVGDALRSAGFEVYSGSDLDRLAIEELLRRFYRGADGAQVAVVYYSGHGVQIAGQNYIIPTDARLATPYDIELQAINVDDILQYLSVHSAVQLLFLDACRDNPFYAQKYWIADKLASVGPDEGLARVTSSLGSLIAFSTTPGKVAYDGASGLSPYTAAFVRRVPVPNREIRDALTQVRRDVMTATNGRQIPWENSSLLADVYLVPAPAPPAVEQLVRVEVRADGPVAPLNLPPPVLQRSVPITVTVDRLPELGHLMLGNKAMMSPGPVELADLARLSFDPTGVPRGGIGLMSYVVSDPWGQSVRSTVAIVAASEPDTAAEQARLTRQRRGEEAARIYFASLDHAMARATIGVGPVSLALPGAPPLPSELATFAELRSAPNDGALRLRNDRLSVGARVPVADLSQLTFEPNVGTEGRTDAAVFALGSAAGTAVTLDVSPVLDDCDVAAAAPLDLQGVAPGKLPNEISADAALKACAKATKDYPAVPRFAYELARAQLAGGLVADARKSLDAAAGNKYMLATSELATLDDLGATGRPDALRADKGYAACAASGDALCLFCHGRDLFTGHGVHKDSVKGLKLMIRAAELGQTYAMNELGTDFLYGVGMKTNVERGIRYYEAGAARNDIYSFNDLGFVYLNGTGRPKNLARALDFFLRAANDGHPFAPLNVGHMYRDGVGVAVNRDEAAKWMELGAQRGDYSAALERAHLYTNAAGRPRDAVETVTYLALAAAISVELGGSDPDSQPARQLKAARASDKVKALAKLERQLGPDAEPVKITTLDGRLVELSRRIWGKHKVRFDLF